MDILFQALPFMAGFPVLAKVLVLVVGIAPTLGAITTAIVSMWHMAIAVLTGISALPGCQKLQAIAAKLQADDAKVDDFEQSKILPFLNRLSAVPLPQKAEAQAAAVAPAGAPQTQFVHS